VQRQLRFTDESAGQLRALEADVAKRGLHRQVLKTLGLLELNTRHPGLNTHEFRSLEGMKGERVWKAYAQTPGAYRVFFHYGPDEVSGKGANSHCDHHSYYATSVIWQLATRLPESVILCV
jgi:hypothetical protein